MTLIELEKFKYYLNYSDSKGEWINNQIWIRSNEFYVFFGEENQFGKTYAMFSKKYFMTIELVNSEKYQDFLDFIADLVNLYREQMGLKVEKYEFWLPHCIVNGITVESKLIAESYGVSRELALEYMAQYDKAFKVLYDKKKKSYFGLPLLSSYEECETYPLKDNSKKYLQGLKTLKKII